MISGLILKWIINRLGGNVWNGLMWLRIDMIGNAVSAA